MKEQDLASILRTVSVALARIAETFAPLESDSHMVSLPMTIRKTKKRGRPAKKRDFVPSNGKRKYTKRAAYWKK